MSAIDLITLSDLKEFSGFPGAGRDSVLPRYITAASRQIEAEVNRRLRYRAPAEVAGAANILASTAWTDGSPGITGQPPAAGRTLIVIFRGPASGKITFTGTVGGVAGQTEAFDPRHGDEQHGLKFFTAISSIAIAGASAAGTVSAGCSRGYVEYHCPTGSDPCELLSMEWPIQNVLSLNEDASRAFGASTILTSGTDYVVTNDERGRRCRLLRLSSALPRPFVRGFRANELIHSAGFSASGVPEDIKDVCARLVKLYFDEIEKERLGMSGASDGAGNWTRFGPSKLTREMRGQLARYRRGRHGAETGERDFDLEAA